MSEMTAVNSFSFYWAHSVCLSTLYVFMVLHLNNVINVGVGIGVGRNIPVADNFYGIICSTSLFTMKTCPMSKG